MLDDETRKKICDAARSYLGTPWITQGRTHEAIDCGGLCIMAYRDAGLTVEEDRPTYFGTDHNHLISVLKKYYKTTSFDNLKPADVVVFGNRSMAHVGLIVNGNPLNFIHCPARKSVVETSFDKNRGLIRGYYTWA